MAAWRAVNDRSRGSRRAGIAADAAGPGHRNPRPGPRTRRSVASYKTPMTWRTYRYRVSTAPKAAPPRRSACATGFCPPSDWLVSVPTRSQSSATDVATGQRTRSRRPAAEQRSSRSPPCSTRVPVLPWSGEFVIHWFLLKVWAYLSMEATPERRGRPAGQLAFPSGMG